MPSEAEYHRAAFGTPSGEDGSADLAAVIRVAAEIGSAMDGYRVIVDKSTVPVGTAARPCHRALPTGCSIVSNWFGGTIGFTLSAPATQQTAHYAANRRPAR